MTLAQPRVVTVFRQGINDRSSAGTVANMATFRENAQGKDKTFRYAPPRREGPPPPRNNRINTLEIDDDDSFSDSSPLITEGEVKV